MLIERELLKSMLNCIERKINFPGVIRFNEVKSEAMCRAYVPFCNLPKPFIYLYIFKKVNEYS